jgi:hypothetical protein
MSSDVQSDKHANVGATGEQLLRDYAHLYLRHSPEVIHKSGQSSNTFRRQSLHHFANNHFHVLRPQNLNPGSP